jgi:hypothetical protein
MKMSVEAGDLKGMPILKQLAKRQRAQVILKGSDKLFWTFFGLAVAAASAVTGYVMDEVAAPKHVAWLTSFVVAALAGVCCEQFRQGRRLDALVALTNLDDPSLGR